MDSIGRHLTADSAFAWFPLVQRPRPPGLPLEARVRQLRELAAQPRDSDRITRAAEVCNKAALIASDCGLPELARALCWRQHEVFDQARPLPASAATLALQPVLNLPRQLIREGDNDGAYAMLQSLYHAARDRTHAVIDGRSVNLRNVTCAPDDHKTICTLVWAALLADGARALARAGRWWDAAERAAAHRGVGVRLLDGRQVTILALAQNGQADQAAALVEQSTTTEPWEQAVQSLLRIHCQRADGADIERHIAAMLTTVLTLLQQSDPSTAVFRTRVGVIALDLASIHGAPQLSQLRAALIATAYSDTYAARDVLAHPLPRQAMTAGQHRDLAELAHQAGSAAEPDHCAGASAGPAVAPPVDGVIEQQQVQHCTDLVQHRADPIGGAGSGLRGVVQDPAQELTDEPMAGLIDGPVGVGHGSHSGIIEIRARARRRRGIVRAGWIGD